MPVSPLTVASVVPGIASICTVAVKPTIARSNAPVFAVADAVVTFAITNLDGTTVGSLTGSGTAVTDDWYWDANVPDASGQYFIAVTVTAGSVVWKGRDRFDVQAY